MNLPMRRTIAEKMLGPIKWKTETTGVCECPGARLHFKSGDTASVLLNGRVPTIYCFHSNCKHAVMQANWKFRAAVMKMEKRSGAHLPKPHCCPQNPALSAQPKDIRV